ncbi:protein UmuC [Microbulbifer aestuariivivens]|uniref:Protein UmuC n=1 Tax=Microbulbifer aestuariivivens TaxID=1908308 RepID=A0ABP9WUJ1_9GAMM
MKRWDHCATQIALVDVNNFYVSSERAFDPVIRHKPVAVYSNNDGCVIARCAEVKAMGVKMGVPEFEVRDLFRARGVVARSSNYALYHDMSMRFVASLEQFCPQVEQYSIDESFLHFHGFGAGLAEHCQRLVAAVQQWTSMPCCAGIAPTRTLAKAANHFAKTLGVPGGVLQVGSEYHRQQLLKQLPVGEVWGVGRRIARRLAMLDIHTAWDLAAAHVPTIRKAFGVTLERTLRELQGVPCIELAPLDQAKHEIVSGRMFGRRLTQFDDVMAAVANHVQLAGEKLSAQDGVTGRLTVSVQAREPGGDWRYLSGHAEFRPAVKDLQVLTAAARSALKEVFLAGREYRRASVCFSALERAREQQHDLFGSACGDRDNRDNQDNPSQQNNRVQQNNLDHHDHKERLSACLADINQRFGRGGVVLASARLSDEWQMKRAHLSPAYTTDFRQLPVARTG